MHGMIDPDATASLVCRVVEASVCAFGASCAPTPVPSCASGLAGGMLRLRPTSRLGYLERPQRTRMASPAWQLTSPPTLSGRTWSTGHPKP